MIDVRNGPSAFSELPPTRLILATKSAEVNTKYEKRRKKLLFFAFGGEFGVILRGRREIKNTPVRNRGLPTGETGASPMLLIQGYAMPSKVAVRTFIIAFLR